MILLIHRFQALLLDGVRRRVQHDTLHRRGHKQDPLYRGRRLLRAAPTVPGRGLRLASPRATERRGHRRRGRRLGRHDRLRRTGYACVLERSVSVLVRCLMECAQVGVDVLGFGDAEGGV